jgi:hypothetical protein
VLWKGKLFLLYWKYSTFPMPLVIFSDTELLVCIKVCTAVGELGPMEKLAY